MTVAVHAFPEDEAPARRLAQALSLPLGLVDLHVFPDGETLPTVPGAVQTVLIYRSLDRPNDKIVPLLLACDAWRRAGARRLVLVAPYLCYLRQDTVFAAGQPLSRDVIAPLLAQRFERVVTVDPHLHRTLRLDPVFAGAQVTVLSAARDLARAVSGDDSPIVVGPDQESAAWAGVVAAGLNAPHITFTKERLGDREVRLSLPKASFVRSRRVVLVDDVCASGATLELAVRMLRDAGAVQVDICVTHALFDAATDARLRQAGAARIVSTDSCAHPTNAVALDRLLATALQRECRAVQRAV
jgi:ribose-phosphate pyrophosphokinase